MKEDNRLRFPREEEFTTKQQHYVWKGIPRLDLSKIKDSKFLIDQFLVESTIQLAYGKFGTRKTTLMLLAGWSVSQGRPYFGRKTRERWVLYIDYENPAVC